jgi:hypothetical protein
LGMAVPSLAWWLSARSRWGTPAGPKGSGRAVAWGGGWICWRELGDAGRAGTGGARPGGCSGGCGGGVGPCLSFHRLPASSATLRGPTGIDRNHDNITGGCLVPKAAADHGPPLGGDGPVKAPLGRHVDPRRLDAALGRAQHRRDGQVLHDDQVVGADQDGGGLLDPLAAAVGLGGAQAGDGGLGPGPTLRAFRWRASRSCNRRSRLTPPGRNPGATTHIRATTRNLVERYR